MTTSFLSVATSTLDGQAYVRFQDEYGTAYTVYPEGRVAPSEIWFYLQSVIGFQQGHYFACDYTGKLSVVSYGSDFTLIFSTAALATYCGFDDLSTAGTQYVELAADELTTIYEFDLIGAEVKESNASTVGHGHGAGDRTTRDMKIDAVGSRANVSGFITAIEQDAYVGYIDSYSGAAPWTVKVSELSFEPVATTKARLKISGPARF